ncbi:MAG: hypothetical protein AABX88_00730 [Nanoarchaeota archaeon]
MVKSKETTKKLEKFLESEGFVDWQGGRLPKDRLTIDFIRQPKEMVVYVKKSENGKVNYIYKIYEKE